MLFIPHAAPPREARLIQRRDRFLADVELSDTGEAALAYCVNPGRMEAFSRAGARIWLLPAATRNQPRGGRRLAWTWELIEHEGTLCDTNTQRPNYIVRSLLEQRLLPGFREWAVLQAERTVAHHTAERPERPRSPKRQSRDGVTKQPLCAEARQELAEDDDTFVNKAESSNTQPEVVARKHRKPSRPPISRLDFWMKGRSGEEHYVEVKNCHMVYPDGNAYFPDSISHRASRHVRELAALVAQGHRSTALFVVQRGDVRGAVRPSAHHDPEFALSCREAATSGVVFRAVVVSCSLEGLTVEREAPVDLAPYDTVPVAAWTMANRLHTGWIRSMSKQRVANGPFPHEIRNLVALRKAISGKARLETKSAADRCRKREDAGEHGGKRVRTSCASLPAKRNATPGADALDGCESCVSQLADLIVRNDQKANGSTSSKFFRHAVATSSMQSVVAERTAVKEATLSSALCQSARAPASPRRTRVFSQKLQAATPKKHARRNNSQVFIEKGCISAPDSCRPGMFSKSLVATSGVTIEL
ncbi:unnamed protein product [Prorocentrum cordatum]|uniref:Sugar fermentation stimulation protein C-terminal domain-containing protein n=1 Tax=Prorocentrum cordatum TaxID=2364126 RepID=A0ABN9Y9V6_9DINO|nr:unnamed protein product [Polarella glacialis]